MIQAANGDLYGTTLYGGLNNGSCLLGSGSCGTIFKISPTGTLTTLYSFCSQSSCTDGANPNGSLLQATDGGFYGTTSYGGVGTYCPISGGCGTIFRITPTGTLTTLYSFCPQSGGCKDGANPTGALLQAANGDFYGTTSSGGVGTYCPTLIGCGTIFRITPNGTLTTVYSFCSQTNCTDGQAPEAGLVQGTNGDLYGTNVLGGANGYGTMFSLSVGLGPFVETRPTIGMVGEAVTILGYKLTSATSVTFNGTPATFSVEAATAILAAVPAGATTGKVQVITPGGTLSGNVAFEVVSSSAGVPTAVSVTPSSGSVASQTFTLQFADTAGASRLQTVWVYFSSTLADPAVNSCLLYYNVTANVINLAANNGMTWATATPGTAITLQNSQCSLYAAGSSVVLSGNTLTLTLPMTFYPTFAGAIDINLYAADVSGSDSGRQQLGTWSVPAAAGVPTAVSVTPSSGSVASQTFTLQYADTAGASSLQTVWVYFSATLADPAVNSCLLYYNVAANVINLAQDNGTTWATATPGVATTLQNSQCLLSVAGTTVVPSGNTLTLTLPMTFFPYAGAININLYAADVSGSNSGWQQLGTWTIP
jgi:uncharacterized repeat protein (TIGR03803 family)